MRPISEDGNRTTKILAEKEVLFPGGTKGYLVNAEFRDEVAAIKRILSAAEQCLDTRGDIDLDKRN